MGTTADKLNLLLNTKAAIREAIVAKGQAVADTDPFSSYPGKIAAIQTGVTLPELTNPGAAGDLLSGKQLIDANGNVLTGTMPSKSASDLTASGATVTVPAGHYAEQASKSVAAATQATPSISVNSSGLITASATQTAGYVAAGTKSATQQLTTQAEKTVTPGRTAQTAVAAGRYTTGAVTVAGDADLIASNIKSGVSIFGVAGTADVPKSKTCTIVNSLSSTIICYSRELNSVPISAGVIKSFSVTEDEVVLIQSIEHFNLQSKSCLYIATIMAATSYPYEYGCIFRMDPQNPDNPYIQVSTITG